MSAQIGDRESKLFERPISIKTIPAKPTKNGVNDSSDMVGEIRCTYYPDLMIREMRVDQLDPEAASLLRGIQPICSSWNEGG